MAPSAVTASAAMESADGISWFFNYHPYRKGKNPRFDDTSRQVLDLKQRYSSAVEHFFQELDARLASGLVICTVPSSNPQNDVPGIRMLARMLVRKKNRVDGTECLVRIRPVDKAAHGGERSEKVHLDSIELRRPELIRGQQVLLLDDVTTTGCSLRACRTILQRAKPAAITCVAVARTQ